MLEKPLRMETNDFKTLVSLSSGVGSEEFAKKLVEEVKKDNRFSLHYATTRDAVERIRNLGLLVDYASHIKADMILYIRCNPLASAELEMADERVFKPAVKVLGNQLMEMFTLCKEMACITAFREDEEQEVLHILGEIQKKKGESISIDFILRNLRELSESADVRNKMEELRRYLKRGTVFISIDASPNPQGIDSQVAEYSNLIRMLHDYYSTKNELPLRDPRVVLI